MCGITGIFAFNLVGKFNKIHVTAATMALHKRGPDFQDIYLGDNVALGHRRLSIIDTSDAGNQPMWDDTGRYCIVFNGEIFNFPALRQELENGGVTFRSHCDTEVLLRLYIRDGVKCLTQLNGFFAFCIYDRSEETLFLARDRFGVKPLYYLFDEDKFIFASEMKAMLHYGIEREIDETSLLTYLQLNYIPPPHTIIKGIHKLLPGHYLRVRRQKLEDEVYYTLHDGAASDFKGSYEEAQEKLRALLDAAVQRRLISDVPLGAFLSGGIDSSVITGLAARHKPDLHTFSIGFRDQKFFDETEYARLVADHFKTNHTVFSLTNDDLYRHVHNILDYIDEPFADSSAIAVYILSQETRKHATVALSGDGADELFGGYNKHEAFRRSFNPGLRERIVAQLQPLWRLLPRSRNNAGANTVRQLLRFSRGMKAPLPDRYWLWAGFATPDEAMHLLGPTMQERLNIQDFEARKASLLSGLTPDGDINDVLRLDMRMVLAGDMLHKVDLMSMANSLEVRVPFLDVEVVNFVSTLPGDWKINDQMRKRILQDAFRDMLPAQLYNRPKKGFEVPLLKWFRKEMRTTIQDDLLADSFIRDQGLFNPDGVRSLKRKLFSSNPGDVHARVWALLVFQHWWKKYLS
ncbi:MAG TPA: asparagine synthase (glutamine-hydrolyzing) [Cyclobacteriaceae bacterium]|nr:asparagine synthase (glutamine-hydrolyzing) [Cyclobacteriaceae bacterium]